MLSEILNYRKIYKRFYWESSKLVILYYSYSNNFKCQPIFFTSNLKFEVYVEIKTAVFFISTRSVIFL